MNRYRNIRTGAEIEIPSELISPDWELIDGAEEEAPEEEPEEEENNGRGVRKRK
ncbi:MAG: hypothetical protein IJ170_08995 [Ruminococcus sp.]|nr:hypothetical protein [Ruminococcus sp.]